MNGIADVKMPIKAYFFPKDLKAPSALCPVLRPSADSSIINVKPKVTTSTTLVMRNTPPPYCAARYGNRHRFPKPIAEAAAAKMNAHLPDQDARAPPELADMPLSHPCVARSCEHAVNGPDPSTIPN